MPRSMANCSMNVIANAFTPTTQKVRDVISPEVEKSAIKPTTEEFTIMLKFDFMQLDHAIRLGLSEGKRDSMLLPSLA